jgi:glycosyltransferase involved in cell wall biosynthesis
VPHEIILDLSRLLSRVLHPTPTGVDRVEMAYARGLIAAAPQQLAFAAVQPTGMYGRLPRSAVFRFLDATERAWQDEGHLGGTRQMARSARSLWALRPRLVPRKPSNTRRIYVQASPHHLDRADLVESILRREQARFLCMVHDLIPIEYPEFARPGGAEMHRRRIATVAAHADVVVTNSLATQASLTPFLVAAGRAPIVRVAHLGTAWDEAERPAESVEAEETPYFVCVGTIEPRKNHLLLLNIWRRLAEQADGKPIPKLLVIGRRGWENEQVVDMLERCPPLAGHVEEHGRVPDREVRRLIAGARALLLPSFAEGYGMPVTEALALGTPVICSDLPALREAGGDLPTYLDPLDGPAWMAAIQEHAHVRKVVPRGARVLPSWDKHIAILMELVHKLAE